MKKPLYQQLINAIGWMLAGITALAGLIGSFGDPSAWLSIKTVSIFTLISVGIYLLLMVLFRYRRIKWVTDTNQIIYIVKLGGKIIWSFLGGLLLLWYSAINNTDKKKSLPVVVQQLNQPVFNSANKRLKILILPWEQECKYQEKTYDIGRVIQKRLDELGRKDNIPFSTHYLTDSIDFKPEMADSLMNAHHADLILYGAYSFKECEGGTADKICFNYQTNTRNWQTYEENGQTEYKMTNFNGLEDIRKGNGKEGIGYIIYWIAGIAEIKQRKFAEAIKMIKQINGYEENENILFRMACCYHVMNDHINAKICNQKVIKINPANTEAAIHLGVTYAKLGEIEKAKESLEEVLKYCPDNVEALMSLGEIYYLKNDTLTGRIYFGRITGVLPPDNHLNLAIIGNAFNSLGNYAWAKDYLEKATRIEPDNANYWMLLAQSNKHLKDTAYALRCCEKAIKIDPYKVDAHYLLAWLYYNKKDYARAQSYYLKTVELSPSYAQAWALLSLNYYVMGNYEKSRESIEKSLALAPENKAALTMACLVYKDSKIFDKWRESIEAILKLDSTNLTMWNDLGLANNKLKDHKKALSCFTHTLKMFPENAATYYYLAITYSQMREKKDALNYLAKSISCDATVKRYVGLDSNFLWLKGDIELCNITYNENVTNTSSIFTLWN